MTRPRIPRSSASTVSASSPARLGVALRGALLPVVSYLGPAFAALLTGSVVVEEIFNLPGVGTHFVRSALNRDYNLVLGTIIMYSSLLVFLNMFVDILYTVLDPRVSYDDD